MLFLDVEMPEMSGFDLIEKRNHDKSERIILTEGQSHLFIQIKDIVHVEGSGSYSFFFLRDERKITTSKRLNYYWLKLKSAGFIRPHPSFLVKIDHVLRYDKSDGGELLLTNNHRYPVSGRVKDEIKIELGIKKRQ